MSKPKITIFQCTLIYTGGGERIIFGQLDGLKKRGYDVCCFTPVLDKKRCYPDIIKNYPIKTFLPQLPSWFPLRHAVLLLTSSILAPLLAFRFKDTDVFIGENQPGVWLAFIISKILKKPYLIYTCHPNKMVYPRSLKRGQIWKTQKDFLFLSLFFELFKPLLKYLDKISFSSSRNQVLINGYFIGREFFKAYQVDWLACPSGALVSKKKKIKKANIYKGRIKVNGHKLKKPYLLFTGRHEVWKRIDLLIKIMSKIAKKIPNITLIIPGGSTSHTNDLVKLTKTLGLEKKVLFIGKINQEDLIKLYSQAVVYLFPSQKEDFGIVIIEAMGAGVPVVAWNSAGPKDIVVNGKTGFLAKPFDLNDFSGKVIKILQDKKLRRIMGREAWKRVKKHFSWEKHLDILEGEIKRVRER